MLGAWGDVRPHPTDNVLGGGARRKYLLDAGRLQSWDIILGNYAAAEHRDIVGALLLEQCTDPRQQGVVSAGKDRQPDTVHILLNRR